MLLVSGWGISVLLIANLPLAERLGHALFDGQIYFTERSHLMAAGVCVVVVGGALLRLSRALLLSHFSRIFSGTWPFGAAHPLCI